ncbi:hypothetical protein AB4Z52_13700 [Rhizobium sp. 2YAF20]|uniref:hypothetical protein n=1 Tax=Rhizobium sp. 2YAF20 TaxID=3233027 RepID=UPI003F95F21D
MKNSDSELLDYTTTLNFLCGDMIAEACSVVLDERQFQVLLEYLDRIAALGDGVNFALEQCVDYRPGYGVSWDNKGSEEQDRAVDRIMDELVMALGFDAGSVPLALSILDKVAAAEPEEWDRMPGKNSE